MHMRAAKRGVGTLKSSTAHGPVVGNCNMSSFLEAATWKQCHGEWCRRRETLQPRKHSCWRHGALLHHRSQPPAAAQ
jgi:hypothetical protein